MTAPSTTRPALDPSRLRRALGRVPTSVAVVTGVVDGERVGMTVGSLTSVSSDPPLIGFFAAARSHTFSQLRRSSDLCVSVLSEAQGAVCYGFASRDGAKFDCGEWDFESGPAPRLMTASARIECTPSTIFDAGDHVGMFAAVTDVDYSDQRPLVFYRGKLARLHPSVTHHPATSRLDWWSL
ncbi:flavin reductase family protein [Rhodococcus sp. SORGH_AS_0301]|uniref:flavin reductase family protein n=1 Tax=Rhodococcus sp. SORGH_AS_0301 TaxID=3041780 RepID=UPI00277F20D7|nr:flavin reductase family protein [Rhodococcus sp. SORGH_AS_0301]MDQ1181819.1 3-hydroxy-9,10-secoandrosta-1,3,5(10)-triene-9,17-dione monooxygenase reductase component [Rhodococcus sp. SORGH_AS_0301]